MTWNDEQVCTRCGMRAWQSEERDRLGPLAVRTELDGQRRDDLPGCTRHPMGQRRGMPHEWQAVGS